MDFSKPQFQSSHLAEVTGLSPETLQTWANRGKLLSSTPGSVGSGQRRLYSAQDVIRVRLVQRLKAFGLPVSVASDMCSAKLDDGMIALIHDSHSRLHKEIQMCISRGPAGYKTEFVNVMDKRILSLKDAAKGAPIAGRPLTFEEEMRAAEDSPLSRAVDASIAAEVTRTAYLAVNIGEVVSETLAALEKLAVD